MSYFFRTKWKIEGFWFCSDNIKVRFGMPMTGNQRGGYVWMLGNSELHLGCIYLFLISSMAENFSGK